MRQITLNRQLLGLEDLLFGTGTVTQNRANQVVTITEINAGNLPFDETRTLVEFAQDTNLEGLGNSVEAINNLNNNLDKLLIVEDNLPIINNVEAIKESIVTLDTNILALQNIDTNMSSINTVEDNLPIINNVEAIKESIVTLDTNILALQNIDTNMYSINTVEDNLPEVVSVAQTIVPNLTEILNVDTLAAQVTQDKSDISSMKLVVETIYDTFDDRFLGTKILDPTLDNDGNALIDGAMYFNTSSNTMKVYDVGTTTWYSIPQIYLSALLDVQLTSITTGDILVWNGTKWSNTANPKVDSIQFNGGTGTEGTVSWNSDEGTLDLVANTTTLQIGQETYINAKNQSGGTIAEGIVVMAAGTMGASGRILIAPYDGLSAPKYILGITTESISNGSDGKITTFGKIRGLDTSVWSEGDELFVTTSGGLTNVEPVSGVNIAIAYVINSHASTGTIMVRFTPYDENLSYSKTEIDSLYGNIDNISDLNKPISTDTQTALDLKAPLDSAALVNPTINGVAQSGYSGFKNYIINGGFDIWQRGNGSFTGWNRSCDMNVAPDTTVQSKYVDTTYGNCILCTGNSTAQSILYSAIELTTVGNNSQFTVGKTFTFSVLIKSNIKVKPNFVFRDSLAGTNPVELFDYASIAYKGGNNVWELLSWTFIVSVNATSLNSCLAYSLTGETADGTSYIAQVQLEEGSVATPFENRPIGLELSLCQRYFQLIRQRVIESRSASEYASVTTTLPNKMRTTPTATLVSTHSSVNIGMNIIAAYTEANFSRQITAAATGVIDSDLTYSLAAEL